MASSSLDTSRRLDRVTTASAMGHAGPYRADIDGLRAVAILAVLGFHAFPRQVSGGFVGVDVFFVLSGFLITSLLRADLSQDRFSIASFYVRRVRRLFPALALVMATCLLLGWFVLFPDEYAQLGKEVAAGTTFVSNALLWHQSGYFDRAAETKPLLHLWSLAVEEQFYLLWPCWLALAWGRAWNIPRVLAGMAATSFALNIGLLWVGDANTDFYAPWARLWELSAGGLLAAYRPAWMSARKTAQSVLGLLLVVASIFLLDNRQFYPGLWAVFPVAGTCLLINAGAGAWVNRTVLSHPAAVGLGLISFPLYLWHWPLLVFGRLLLGSEIPSWVSGGILVLSLGLAWLTWRLLEKKIRYGRSRRTVPVLIACFVALFYGSALMFLQDGYPERYHHSLMSDAATANASRRSDGSCARLLGRADRKAEVCLTNSAAPRLMIAGDSHAMALYSAIHGRDIAAEALLVAWHSCPLYPNLQAISLQGKNTQKDCLAMARAALDMAKALPSIGTVVLANFAYAVDDAPSEYSLNGRRLSHREAFVSGTDDVVRQLLQAGKTPVLLLDVPHLRAEPQNCLVRLPLFPGSQVCGDTAEGNENSRRDYVAAVRALKARHPGLVVYDPAPIFCPARDCLYRIGQQALYTDTHHLSPYGAFFLLDHMKQEGALQF